MKLDPEPLQPYPFVLLPQDSVEMQEPRVIDFQSWKGLGDVRSR